MSDNKIVQLKTWLDSYLNIARGYLEVKPNKNLELHFMSKPPHVLKIHCTTANFNSVGIKDGEFYYNGPKVNNNTPQLYYMSGGVLTVVNDYNLYFGATLISLNPEYVAGQVPVLRATEVIVQDYINRNGGELAGALTMPNKWVHTKPTELVSKAYVDTLRLEVETRLGALESEINTLRSTIK